MDYKFVYKYKTKYDLYDKLVRIHLAFNSIFISEQHIKVLVYFCMHGINKDTEKILLDNSIVTSSQVVSNIKTSLKKQGLIQKERYQDWYVNEKIRKDLKNYLNIMVLCKYE